MFTRTNKESNTFLHLHFYISKGLKESLYVCMVGAWEGGEFEVVRRLLYFDVNKQLERDAAAGFMLSAVMWAMTTFVQDKHHDCPDGHPADR